MKDKKYPLGSESIKAASSMAARGPTEVEVELRQLSQGHAVLAIEPAS